MRRPPLFSVRLLVSEALLAVLLSLLWPALESAAAWVGVGNWVVYAMAATAMALLVWRRATTRPPHVPAIELGASGIKLPHSAESQRVWFLDYTDVLHVGVRGWRLWPLVVLKTKPRLFIYPLWAFQEPAQGLQLPHLLRTQALRSLGSYPSAWLESLRGPARQFAVQAPVGTYALLLLNGLFFLTELAFGIATEPLRLVTLGANAPALVQEGQLWRLAIANFLHGGLAHLGLNALSLYLLGGVLERLIGTQRLLLIYLVSALGGALASTLFSGAIMSVGASTSLFGMLGAFGALTLRAHSELPAGFRQPLRIWVLVLAISIVMPMVMPRIDWTAHAGGFGAGALLILILYVRKPRLPDIRPLSLGPRLALGVVVLFFVGSLGAMVVRGIGHGRVDRLKVANQVAEQIPARSLNTTAWYVAIDAGATAEELETARLLAQEACSQRPDVYTYWDTLATLEHRLGRHDAAIEAQRTAVQLGQNQLVYTQMGRFLRARRQAWGVARHGPVGRDDLTVSLRPTRPERPSSARDHTSPNERHRAPASGDDAHSSTPRSARENTAGDIEIRLERRFPEGVVAYIQVLADGTPIGLCRAVFGSAHPEVALIQATETLWQHDNISFEVLLLDATGCQCAPDAEAWNAFVFAPEADAWPGPISSSTK